MKIATPEIRWHFGSQGINEAILSIDILHPNKNLVSNENSWIIATGGADKEVKLWLYKTEEDQEKISTCPISFIHSFALHDRSVNAVRFSPNGECLASASDDNTIMVWTRPKTFDADWRWDTISSDSSVNRIFLSCGHTGDVVDITWCPSSKFLASASVDNSITIWSIPSGRVVKKLRDHNQFVQGVSWDPRNEFLASQANDRTCRVFALTGFAPVMSTTSTVIPAAKTACTPASSPSSQVNTTTTSAASTPSVPKDENSAPVNESTSTTKKAKKPRRVAKKCQCIHVIRDRVVVVVPEPSKESTTPIKEDQQQLERKIDLTTPVKPSGNSSGGDNEKTNHRLFIGNTFTSFFRRLSWTPDGTFLLVPSGLYYQENAEECFATYVFHRSNLQTPWLSLPCPHNSPSLAVRCSPVLHKLREGPENVSALPYRIIYAVITLDSIMIYDSQQQYPIFVIRELHYADLTDCAWTPDGKALVITSLDGYCSFIHLNEVEVGTAVVTEDIPDCMKTVTSSIYSKNLCGEKRVKPEATALKASSSNNSTDVVVKTAESAVHGINTLIVRKKVKKVQQTSNATTTTMMTALDKE